MRPPELVGAYGRGASEEHLVGEPVLELVHGYGEVPGLGGAGVQVPVVLGQQVHVVEDGAGPVTVPHRLHEPHVEQHGAVEGVRVSLVDDVYAVVELLALEDGVEVAEERGEVGEAPAVGDDQGHHVPGPAARGPVLAAPRHPRVLRQDGRPLRRLPHHRHPPLQPRRHRGAHRRLCQSCLLGAIGRGGGGGGSRWRGGGGGGSRWRGGGGPRGVGFRWSFRPLRGSSGFHNRFLPCLG